MNLQPLSFFFLLLILITPAFYANASVENYVYEFGNIDRSTGTDKKVCGYSSRYQGSRIVARNGYKQWLESFARQMSDWSRGKIGYAKVEAAYQMPYGGNLSGLSKREKRARLILRARQGHISGGSRSCNLKVMRGPWSMTSNAPTPTQVNLAHTNRSSFTLKHEAGHTYGLDHDRPMNEQCTRKKGNAWSQMSGIGGGFNIPQLHWMGWLQDHQVKQLEWDLNSRNHVFGEHWVSIRPLKLEKGVKEGEYPYGLVIDLRRSGNRLWLTLNKEIELQALGKKGYRKVNDALVARISAPFDARRLNIKRWKETTVHRYIDENNAWDDSLMDDMVISVVERKKDALLVRIEKSGTAGEGSCGKLPEASYKITRHRKSIKSINQMRKNNNLDITFKFNLKYADRDSKCSSHLCDTKRVNLSQWETCYFDADPKKTNLLRNKKVTIEPRNPKAAGICESPHRFRTHFSRSDREAYVNKFSNKIMCKAAYQCFYKIDGPIAFPVNGNKQVNVSQNVEIKTVFPNDWKNIIKRKRNNSDWENRSNENSEDFSSGELEDLSHNVLE